MGQVFFFVAGPGALDLGPGAQAIFFNHSSVGGIVSTVGCCFCHRVLSCNHPLSVISPSLAIFPSLVISASLVISPSLV